MEDPDGDGDLLPPRPRRQRLRLRLDAPGRDENGPVRESPRRSRSPQRLIQRLVQRRGSPGGSRSASPVRRVRPAAYHHAAEQPREENPYTNYYADLATDQPLELLDAERDRLHMSRPTAGRPRLDRRPVPANQPVYRAVAAGERAPASANGAAEQFFAAGRQPSGQYVRPAAYIRSAEGFGHGARPLAEYDMDEQDDEFLALVNGIRAAQFAAAPIPLHVFEIAMTLLETEWFALQQRLPKAPPARDAQSEFEDSLCAICNDGECENSNAIVFCDGCNVAVHQECYGVPFIPEGQWLCRRCLAAPQQTVRCIFCPNTFGAFKQTESGHWAHLLCAVWIPEVGVGNRVYMEPIEGVQNIPRQRWKLVCYLCKQKTGACIQCMNKNCFAAFHATCARRAGLYLKLRSSDIGFALDDYNILEALCDRHTPADWRAAHDTDGAMARALSYFKRLQARKDGDDDRAELKIRLSLAPPPRDGPAGRRVVWKMNAGSPVVPYVIYRRVAAALAPYVARKRKDFAMTMCRYWALKKELKRGATLLKRLQLELEFAPDKDFTPDQNTKRRAFTAGLRRDLAALVRLAEGVVAREQTKLAVAELQSRALDVLYDPRRRALRALVDAVDPDRTLAREDAPMADLAAAADAGGFDGVPALGAELDRRLATILAGYAPESALHGAAARARDALQAALPALLREDRLFEAHPFDGGDCVVDGLTV
ncbi:PHD-zinc-finger like domain-containing protein [Dipodascopsis tothii]|uniref:PHD-zinc-finger like domain-containing protein n=1 Tax=Dipodascopsis tothii TaxID=44089 RepID=UPI0034CEF53F